MDSYEINTSTLAILPNGEETSKVIEKNNEYIVQLPAFTVMENSCEYFGSSYEGRVKGTKSALGISYKPPIVIEESRDIIFFPTTSPTSNRCSWISLKNIKSYERIPGGVKIIFENNKEAIFPVSLESFENQLYRATRLESVLRKRRND